MPLTKMTTNVNNIQALSDRPNTTDGLTSAELKERFDKAGADLKDYLNTVLTEELDTNFGNISSQIETAFNTLIASARATEYPIGRIVEFYDNLDHSNYLGFTWERCLTGKVPVGIDTNDTDFDTIAKTGGSKYLQEHHHDYLKWYTQNLSVDSASGQSTHRLSISNNGGQSSTANNFHTGNVGSNVTTGTAGNLQPYEVVSFWKRVS